MSIAGQVIEELEFAKDGETGSRTEGLFEFGQGRDFVKRSKCLRRIWGSKERDRIMLKFRLSKRYIRNYNTIDG